MLVIMAVDTEVFPVAAILAVDSQELQVSTFKFATALGADPAE